MAICCTFAHVAKVDFKAMFEACAWISSSPEDFVVHVGVSLAALRQEAQELVLNAVKGLFNVIFEDEHMQKISVFRWH